MSLYTSGPYPKHPQSRIRHDARWLAVTYLSMSNNNVASWCSRRLHAKSRWSHSPSFLMTSLRDVSVFSHPLRFIFACLLQLGYRSPPIAKYQHPMSKESAHAGIGIPAYRTLRLPMLMWRLLDNIQTFSGLAVFS